MTEALGKPKGPPLGETALGHVVGIVLGVGGVGMMLSGVVDAIDGGPDTAVLLACGAVVGAFGGLMWRTTKIPSRLRLVDIFVVVTGSWIALALASSLPYLLTGTLDRFDNALFESISGLTTTGATVLRPIEGNSAGILFWRSLTQWIGGIGVVVLVVAVLPVLGGGGMDLLEAEAPGPAGERLSPRVRDTARHLVSIYLGLTVLVGAAYFAVGMSLYDAASHTFTTVSTGGFSPYNASIAHFESDAVEWVAIVGMFLAGGNFALYFRALRGDRTPLLRSVELRVYGALVLLATAYIVLAQSDVDASSHDSVREVLFSVISIASTTGYAVVDFGNWTESAQVLLLLIMPIGAMAGSTAGGVKIVRVIAVASYAARETLRQLHPKMVRPVRVGEDPLEERTAERVVGFVVLALAIFGAGATLVAMTGSDLLTSFSASATTFGNVGPGLGDIGPTSDMLAISASARAVGMAEMLLGRLEIYPVILAFAVIRLPHRVKRFG